MRERRISTCSRISSLLPPRTLEAIAKYRSPVTTRTRASVDAVYQRVRRDASDSARPRRPWESAGALAGARASASGPLFEDIAHAAHGVDQRLGERLVDLRAQTSDVDVDDVRASVEVHVPHLLGDQRPRQDVARVAREQREEQELLRRQVQSMPCPRGAVPDEIDLEVGDL